jgi:PAS domain S-box-containing protein
MSSPDSKIPDFLIGGGEMGERIRAFDWAKTPLGPPENWEQSLKTCVRIMLASSQPIWIGWGTELIKLYNDPYKAIVGGKHPEALGQPASVVWRAIWPDIEPMLKKVMENDQGTYVESQLLIMERNNYPEETYYTFSYTPIPGDKGGTGGMICANTDDTARIINERALQVLRDLGKLSYKEKTLREIFKKAATILTHNDKDFPCAVFYEVNESEMTAKPVAYAGKKIDYLNFERVIDIENPNDKTASLCDAILRDEMALEEFSPGEIPSGYWKRPPTQMLHIPLRLGNNKMPVAAVSLGLNPYRKFDDVFQQFVQLISDQLSLEISIMHAFEEERKRSEALTELDRAKTLFFNNISHEFRTPLTLMLGPLEELLKQSPEQFGTENFASIGTTHRNAMRLLKLVNTLLDFSRIESGRQEANFVKVDISDLTRNLSESFRSVMEKAGLKFVVVANQIDDTVFVDRAMWEKIIFNLLSNAFKYTLVGSVTVTIDSLDGLIILKVVDTGTGIPEKELGNLFKRFHRIHGATGRSFEGTGIGLSMIRELAGFHGGTISAESIEGKGAAFTVKIPAGKDHLNPAQIILEQASDDVISDAFIMEAANMFEKPAEKEKSRESNKNLPKILVVDDNADMRAYITRLLEKQYHIVTAIHGEEALSKIRKSIPDLVLSDIMMPVMDGIELLTKIKENQKTAQLPVILLSARAGEEARIQGYETGADDYLVKPFSSKELVSRIQAQLKIAKTRRHNEEQLKRVFQQAPVAIAIFNGPDHIIEIANERMLGFWDKKAEDILGKPLFTAIPDAEHQRFKELMDNVLQTGERFVAPEISATIVRRKGPEKVYFKLAYEALRDEDGVITGVMSVTDEITNEVLVRKKVEESEKQLSLALEGGELGTFDYYPQENKLLWSARTRALFGFTNDDEVTYDIFLDALHPDDRKRANEKTQAAMRPDGPGIYENEYRSIGKHDGKIRWIRSKGKVSFDDDGKPSRFTGVTQDITQRKQTEEEKQKLIAIIEASHEFIGLANVDGTIQYGNPAALRMVGWDSIKGRHLAECVFPEDLPLAAKLLDKLITEGSFQHEIRFFNEKTGKPFWLLWNGIVIRDAQGEMIGFGSVSTEISERKATEKILRESEERFRSLADNSPMFVYIIEPDTNANISYFNKTWLEYTGISAEDSTGQAWATFVHPDDLEKSFEDYLSAFDSQQPFIIDALRLKRRDGAYRWHTFKGNPRYDTAGEFLGYIGVGFDIHERKLAEESLKESEEQFRTLVETLPQLVWITSHDGENKYTSSRWKEYAGVQPEGPDSWISMIHPDDVDKIAKAWSHSLATGDVYKTEVRIRSKTGEYRWHTVNGLPVLDSENNIVKWVGAFTDIHSEKSFANELEKQVEARTAELAKLNTALEGKNRELGLMNKELESFAYISSHDLQEPLRKIQTFASRIIDDESQNLTERGKDHFRRMQNAAHRMQVLIEDLLAYSRTSTEERNFIPIPLKKIIDEVKEEFAEDLQQKNAVIETGEMHTINIIPFQFRQLLHNLIGNALKFSKADTPPKIFITSTTAAGKTFGNPKLDPDTMYCNIRVSDNGIGFDPAYGEKIFEVFQRLHTRDKYSGTGIGLAIVKKIIDNHNGIISANSSLGEGATFDMYLPA